MKKPVDGAGGVWTWTALDSDSKLIVSWLIGGRDGEYALAFMDDVKDRLANRVQLTTDGHKAYLNAVEEAFGADIDYAMLMKMYGEPEGKAVPQERRYSPAVCTGARIPALKAIPIRRTSARRTSSDRTSPCGCRTAVSRAYECLLEEVREPHAHGCAFHMLVQFHPHSQDAENVAGNGRWRF